MLLFNQQLCIGPLWLPIADGANEKKLHLDSAAHCEQQSLGVDAFLNPAPNGVMSPPADTKKSAWGMARARNVAKKNTVEIGVRLKWTIT